MTQRVATAADSLHAIEVRRRADSYAIALAGREQRITWLEDQLPHFWERPAFVGLTVMVVTILAVLQAVSISIN